MPGVPPQGGSEPKISKMIMHIDGMLDKGVVREDILTGYSCVRCSSKNPKIYVAAENYKSYYGAFSGGPAFQCVMRGILAVCVLVICVALLNIGGDAVLILFILIPAAVFVIEKISRVPRGESACVECFGNEFTRLSDDHAE